MSNPLRSLIVGTLKHINPSLFPDAMRVPTDSFLKGRRVIDCALSVRYQNRSLSLALANMFRRSNFYGTVESDLTNFPISGTYKLQNGKIKVCKTDPIGLAPISYAAWLAISKANIQDDSPVVVQFGHWGGLGYGYILGIYDVAPQKTEEAPRLANEAPQLADPSKTTDPTRPV